MSNFQTLPNDLPIPQDDGACDHLPVMVVPDIALRSTSGIELSLAEIAKTRSVLYIYPMTGRPGRNLPDEWDMIPGARGCTPQSCSFRDHYQELQALHTSVYGLSTQPTAYQLEVKTRLHLPFDLFSDAELTLATVLNLPTFQVEALRDISPDIHPVLIKRMTLVLNNGIIEQVFYPVFPPDQNVQLVLDYLTNHQL
jgi:peroxiredoxin